MNIRWVAQSNLGKPEDIEETLVACQNLDIEFIPYKVIPFSDILPDIPNDKPTIFYGAVNWINKIYKSGIWKPVFFNPQSTVDVWIEEYKDHALNYGAEITTLGKLKDVYQNKYSSDGMIFVRPVSDLKEFAGEVIKVGEILKWANKIQTDTPDILQTKIVVSDPVGIEREWRLFIVDGKVSSGSQYKKYGVLEVKCKLPYEVIVFAEERAKEYSPSPVFVMDVGRSAGNLYVIEVGCFHSAGFYASKIMKIVKDVSEYIMKDKL